jgi:hypothetical protein
MSTANKHWIPHIYIVTGSAVAVTLTISSKAEVTAYNKAAGSKVFWFRYSR